MILINKEQNINQNNNEIIPNNTNLINSNLNDKKIINNKVVEKQNYDTNSKNIILMENEKYQSVNPSKKPTLGVSNNVLVSKSNNNMNNITQSNNPYKSEPNKERENNTLNPKKINENVMKNNNMSTNTVFNKNNLNINTNHINNNDNKKIIPLSNKNESIKPKIFQNIQVNLKGGTPKNVNNVQNKKELKK